MTQQIYYVNDNKTMKQKYQNFNVLKKIMSWADSDGDGDDDSDYNFSAFKKEYEHGKDFCLIIKPENDKQYNEIMELIPYKIDISGNK